ncbi:MAG: hypothetical protein NTY02_19955, partial [Acidobacteria bacterium]|nr:hypothetical protein [Acidobacteriota bacterium]
VIEPYGALTISGWQTGLSDARRFEFTTEERSYGGILGRTANLGVITAVFFRERVPAPLPVTSSRNEAKAESAGAGGVGSADAASRPSAAPPAAQSPASAESANRDYAATGIGDRVDHAVREVSMDLDSSPAATIILRYEYRSALVQLGVLPAPVPEDDVLSRRERARGFAPGFCPDPARKW